MNGPGSEDPITPASSRKRPAPRSPERRKTPGFDALLEDQLRKDPALRKARKTLEPKRRVVTALLKLRAEVDLSQKELAEKAGWHPAFVSRLKSFPRGRERQQTDRLVQ